MDAKLLQDAIEMIETLLANPETGECQMCLAPNKGAGVIIHKPDCKTKLLIDRLKIEIDCLTWMKRYREAVELVYADFNDTRARMGLPPLDPRS